MQDETKPPELTEAEWRFIVTKVLALNLANDPLPIRNRAGKCLWLCQECRCEVWADMNEEWQGHRPSCPRELRYAILEKLDQFA